MTLSAVLTKTFHFEAAHYLPGHKGKCARLHGHSYKLEVSVRGAIKQVPGTSEDGMVIDFGYLATSVQASVLEKLDHHNLNEVLSIRTTAEHLAHWIWEALVTGGIPDTLLHSVRLWETATSSVTITHADREEGEA